MKLYAYWRSTTSYRVRIALNLKGLDYEVIPVDLLSGDQCSKAYTALNPGQGVPALSLADGTVLTQSMAIIDYLDHLVADPPLLDADPVGRARALAAAQVIASDIHPVNNLRVVSRLKSQLGASEEDTVRWMCHWMEAGFGAYQSLLPRDARFSFGDRPGIADLCLIPQLYNARRWGLDMAPFPRLTEIETEALALPAFDAARPEHQPDANR